MLSHCSLSTSQGRYYMVSLGFDKFVSSAVAFSLFSSTFLPSTAVFAVKDDVSKVVAKKNGEEKQDSEEARLSVTDALAIGDYIEKNNSLKESKSNEKSGENGEDLNRSDIQKLYNIYMLKLLKKASEDKPNPNPKTVVGKVGNELKDLGDNIKPLFKGILVALVVGVALIPPTLDFLQSCGISLRDALYFVFPDRAKSIVERKKLEVEYNQNKLAYDVQRNLYENHPVIYYTKEIGSGIASCFASVISAIKWWGK